MLDTTRQRQADPGIRPATMVAVEVMVLRPLGRTAHSESGRWPVLALVLDEPNELMERTVRPLFDLIDDSARAHRIAVVAGRCRWSVLGPAGALLRLAVHVTAPMRFDLNVIMPAQLVIEFADLIAGGSTVALTDRRHAGRLTTGRLPIRAALAELVLLGSSPSADLFDLASAR
jgi:hypothetical protein